MTAKPNDEKAIARVDVSTLLPAALAEGFGSVGDIMRDNLGGEPLTPFDLERIKVPSGGGQYWMVATPEKPNGTPVEDLSGVIVYQRLGRQYWSVSMEEGGGGTPPDCSSEDGVTGSGNPGGSCHDCPMAQWGSASKGGRGQACKSSRLLFVVSPDSFLPRVVVVPPTSLSAVKKYMTRLASLGRPFWSVVTRFRLERATNAQNIAYSRIVPELDQVIPTEAVGRIKEYADELRPVFTQVRVDRGDIDGDAD
jgi:hypothetical protein